MPKDADPQVRTGDGSIKANGVSGSVDLLQRRWRSHRGFLKGAVRLHTGDGSIEASDLDGKCDASSSGDGRIRLSGRFDVLNAKSGDGSVGVERAARLQIGFRLEHHFGRRQHRRVQLPADLPVNIDASSGDGHISSDIPVTVEGIIEQVDAPRQNERRRLDTHHPHRRRLHSSEAV